MKFSREDEGHLEKWLVHQFESLHQSNPETLAKYVLSLLRQDRDSMQQFVEEEMQTFLKDNNSQFISRLFDAIRNESYRSSGQEETEEVEIDRRNSYDGDYRRERSGSDEEDSRNRGRLRRRYSDDAGDSQRDKHRERDRDFHRDRSRERSRDRERDRDRGDDRRHDRWRDNRGKGNNHRNNGHGNNSGHNRNFHQQRGHGTTESTSQHDQQRAWMGSGSLPGVPPNMPPPPFPWNAPPHMPFYPPPPFAPPYSTPYPPPAYPPYNPFLSQNSPSANPPLQPPSHMSEQLPPPATAHLETDKSSEVSPEKEISATGAEATASGETASSSNAGKASYEDDLFAQPPANPPPPVYMPMWGYGDTNYMMYNQPPYHGNDSEKQGRDGHRRQSRGNNSSNSSKSNQLPENERCTLRCTGIPTYVKEEDIRAHFEAFGHIVQLEISPMEDHHGHNKNEEAGSSEEKKKTYNECLVQFYSAANAKKCLSSQAPVLNNRFIRIYSSHFNIILPSDVEPLSYEKVEEDKAKLSQEIEPKAYEQQKKKAIASSHTLGVTNKWRRTTVESKVVATDQEADKETEGGASTEAAEAKEGGVTAAATKKEDTELKQEFEQLQTLKQQAEDILKKKEKLLLDSVDKCRQMMEKLETSEESETKATLLQNLENKIVDLQAQLRTVRDQMEKGVSSLEKSAPAPVMMMAAGRGGGRFYGGRAGFVARGGRGRAGFVRGSNKFVNPSTYTNPFLNAANAEAPLSDTGSATVSDSTVNPSNAEL